MPIIIKQLDFFRKMFRGINFSRSIQRSEPVAQVFPIRFCRLTSIFDDGEVHRVTRGINAANLHPRTVTLPRRAPRLRAIQVSGSPIVATTTRGEDTASSHARSRSIASYFLRPRLCATLRSSRPVAVAGGEGPSFIFRYGCFKQSFHSCGGLDKLFSLLKSRFERFTVINRIIVSTNLQFIRLKSSSSSTENYNEIINKRG